MAGDGTIFCGTCGTENSAASVRCVHCSDFLNPENFVASAAEAPALRVRAIAITGIVSAVLLALVHFAGVGFVMHDLPAQAPWSEVIERIDTLAANNEITAGEARVIEGTLGRERAMRAAMASGDLSIQDADRIAKLPDIDQSTVVGVGGALRLVTTLFAFLVGAMVSTVVARSRRTREVAIGLGAAAAVQSMLWLVSVDFSVGAITSGRLMMTGPGLEFTGAPIILLAMALVLSTAVSLVLAYGVGTAMEQALGKKECPHCAHTFEASKHKEQCPSCHRPLKVQVAAHAGPGGMTREHAGAQSLLCTLCAKEYEADVCPLHPQEPLLDARRDDVRYQLLELDTSAGTQRYVQWTKGLGMGSDPAPQPSNGGLCMECARTYETPQCPVHADEPLLDPADEAVRLELAQSDARRRDVAGKWMMFGAFGLAVAASMVAVAGLEFDGSLATLVFGAVFAPSFAAAQVLTPKVAPRKFSQWTGEADAGEFSALVHEHIVQPLRDAWTRALQNMLWLGLSVVVAAGLGATATWLLWDAPAAGGVLGGLAGLLLFAIVTSVIETKNDVVETARSAAKEWKDPYSM